MALTRVSFLIILAVVLEFVVLLAVAVPFPLPRIEAFQAAALLSFMASFL